MSFEEGNIAPKWSKAIYLSANGLSNDDLMPIRSQKTNVSNRSIATRNLLLA